MKTLVSRFVKDESGATAIEYGLIAAGISVAIIAVVNGLGTKLKYDLQQHLDRTQVSVVLMLSYERAPVSVPEPFSLSGACRRALLTHSQPASAKPRCAKGLVEVPLRHGHAD